MRLFSGIPLTPEAQASLARTVAPLWAGPWPVRWTAPDAWHVTLQFYGEQPEATVALLAPGLERAARHTPLLPLATGPIEAVPSPTHARLVWAPVEGPGALELLHHEVAAAASVIGIEPEGRPFRPHLTLGRVKRGGRLPRGAATRFAGLGPGIAWTGDRVVLYESRRAPAGARYAPVSTFTLREPS